nr:hypothetical protein [Candidatus Sigynarchaeota archaeon]
MSIIENVENLIESLKSIKIGEPFSFVIQNNSPDPYKPPSGIGWKKAISLEGAMTNIVKEIHAKIGHGTGNTYFYR